MAKPYDSTAKFLVEAFPADWLALAGVVPEGPVEVIDANLSTITAEADKVIRVAGPEPWLAHVELQASHEVDLPRRLLRYNALLDDRHGLPTRSLVVLLRPEADGPGLSGVHQRSIPGGPVYLEFRYDVIRAWLRPVESVLAGGLGTLPIAPVADVAVAALPEVIRRMGERIDREPPPLAGLLWSAAGLLMGLRHPPDLIEHLLRGVRDMKESSFYQHILAEGRAVGLAEGEARGMAREARRLLIRMGTRRFGPPDPATIEAIERIATVEEVEEAADRLFKASSWAGLLAGPGEGA